MSQSNRLVLRASRGAVFQLASRYRYLALASASANPVFDVTPDHLLVLSAFDRPSTVPDAADHLEATFGLHSIAGLVDDLLTWDLLLVCGGQRGQAGGFGHIEAHLPMLADTARVLAYAEAIAAHSAGRRVAEIGCGTGILSMLAAKAQARWVWAVEESDIAELAQEVFEANEVDDAVTLVRASSYDVEPPERVDLLIHELFGVDPFDEGVLASVHDARRRWLRPGGRLLPSGFTVRACGVGGPRWQAGLDQLRRIHALSEALKIDLRPVSEQAHHAPTRRVDPSEERPTPEELRTAVGDLVRLDLMEDCTIDDRWQVHLPSNGTGSVGTILVWFDVHLDESRTLSTSPFDPLTHWGWQLWDLSIPVELPLGHDLAVEVSIQTREGCPQLELLAARAVPSST